MVHIFTFLSHLFRSDRQLLSLFEMKGERFLKGGKWARRERKEEKRGMVSPSSLSADGLVSFQVYRMYIPYPTTNRVECNMRNWFACNRKRFKTFEMMPFGRVFIQYKQISAEEGGFGRFFEVHSSCKFECIFLLIEDFVIPRVLVRWTSILYTLLSVLYFLLLCNIHIVT